MATYNTSSLVGAREDLSNMITDVSPTETPVYSKANQLAATGTTHEWQIQELRPSNADNAAGEGDDAAGTTPKATERLGNNTQILTKDAKISGTVEEIDKAGRESEVAYQQMIQLRELKTDVEASMTSKNTKSSADPRKSGGLASYIRNINTQATQSSFLGDGSNVPTAGTDRNISIDIINKTLQTVRSKGGNPDCIVAAENQVGRISALKNSDGIAQTRYISSDNEKTKLVYGVSVYVSDFGELELITDVHAPNDVVYCLESEYIGWASIDNRNFMMKHLGDDGDSTRFMIIQEGCLVVDSPLAHGAIFDLNV